MKNTASKKNFSPSILLPSFTAGFINAVILVSVEISLAVLIFSGDLAPFLSRGIGLMLLGTAIFTIVIALTSSLPNMVAVPQDTPGALMALVSAGIAVALTGKSPEVLYSTTIAAIMTGTILTGLVFFLLGWFKVSSFARNIPYPVIGGFLAGTGYLLLKGAMGIMTEMPLTFENLPKLFDPDMALRWLPGFLFGLGLLMILRRYNHFLIMPGALIGALVLFYLYLFLNGVSLQEAGSNGWLLGPFPEGGLLSFSSFDTSARVEWSAIFVNAPIYLTLIVLSVISLLLNSSGLEATYKQEIDLDRELIASGGVNILIGLLGVPVGYQTLGFSALAKRFGINNRLVGVITGLLCAAALFFGASVISYIPKVALAGMLFFLGFSFMSEWIVDSFKQLPLGDYLLIWAMLFVIEFFGFLQAIGAGILIAALLFVASYGKMTVIKDVFSGDSFRSLMDRTKKHKKALRDKGSQIHILRLQGYIFFGSTQQILENIRKRMALKDAQPLRYLVLDFKRVRRLDSSAIFGLSRLMQFVEAGNISMAWTTLSEELRAQLERNNLLQNTDSSFVIKTSLDYGLEWCENKLLAKESAINKVDFVDNILSYMSASFTGIERIKQFIEKETFNAGEYIIKQGEMANDLFFIESGMASVELETPGGKKTRLRSIQSGVTVGEVAFYLGGARSASVIADQPCLAYRLTSKIMIQIQKEDPALASMLHEWLGKLLAERLSDSSRMVELLMD